MTETTHQERAEQLLAAIQRAPLPLGARVRVTIEGTAVGDDPSLFVGFWHERAVQLFNRRVVAAEVIAEPSREDRETYKTLHAQIDSAHRLIAELSRQLQPLIREAVQAGESQVDIARVLGVSRQRVHQIVHDEVPDAD